MHIVEFSAVELRDGAYVDVGSLAFNVDAFIDAFELTATPAAVVEVCYARAGSTPVSRLVRGRIRDVVFALRKASGEDKPRTGTRVSTNSGRE